MTTSSTTVITEDAHHHHHMLAPVIIHQFRPAAELQAFCRFHGLPFSIVNSTYPRYAAHGDLPQIQHGTMFVSSDRCLDYLQLLVQHSGSGSGSGSSSSAISSSPQPTAEITLVHSTLADVETWCFLHSEVHLSCIGAAMPIPLSWFVPRAYRESLHRRLASRGFLADESWVKFVALRAYKSFDTLLSTSTGPFFGGTRPSPLDAAVYGHLYAIRHSGFAGKWIREQVPALASYFQHMRKIYFTAASAMTATTTSTEQHHHHHHHHHHESRYIPHSMKGTQSYNEFELLEIAIDEAKEETHLKGAETTTTTSGGEEQQEQRRHVTIPTAADLFGMEPIALQTAVKLWRSSPARHYNDNHNHDGSITTTSPSFVTSDTARSFAIAAVGVALTGGLYLKNV